MALIASALESGDLDAALLLMKDMTSAELSALALPDRRTPLHYACQHGRIDIAQQMLAKFSINRGDAQGRTPLHTAAQYGHLDIVKYLMPMVFTESEIKLKMALKSELSQAIAAKFRAVVNSHKDAGLNSPLDIACANGRLNVVQHFTETLRFHLTTGLHLAAKHGHFALVRYLVEKDVPDVPFNRRQAEVSTHVERALHAVAATPHLDILQYIIEKYKVHPQNCKSLLHTACRADVRIVKYLVEYGCEPCRQDYISNIPLHIACEHGHLDIVAYLVTKAKCNPNQLNSRSESSMHPAIRSGNVDIMRFLLEHGYRIEGKSPLHFASSSGKLNAVKFLIETKITNCDPDTRDRFMKTPLHYASQKGHLEIAKYLVNVHHCDPLAKDRRNFTPLEQASANGELEMMKFFNTIHKCTSEQKCDHCVRSFHLSAQKGQLEAFKYFIEELNYDPNLRGKWNRTPLHAACIDGHLNVVMYLVETHNCDPGCVDEDYNTPMHLACVKDQVNVVKYFITKLHCFRITEAENVHGPTIRRKPYFYTHDRKISLYLERVLSKIPVRVFIMGNSEAGKSTLMTALTSQYRILGRILKVQEVRPKTAGIIPLTFYSEAFGKVKFYDFAGYEEYYASHEIILNNPTISLILLTVNISLETHEVKKQLHYWLAIILTTASVYAEGKANKHVIVVGSCADKATEMKLKEVQQIASVLMSDEVSIVYYGFIPCDCRYSVSSSMKKLTLKLDTACKLVRAELSTLETVNSDRRCKWFKEETNIFHNTTFMSINSLHRKLSYALEHKLIEMCISLNNSGHILYLPDEQNPVNSIVVFDEDSLLTEVHGCLKDIKKVLNNDSGILNEKELTGITSSLHANKCYGVSVQKYLLLAQFCTAITSKQLIMPPESLELGTHYFFPNLVLNSRPKDLSKTEQCGFSAFYTWSLKCSNARHFFTPRYIHTMFIQIVKCEPDTGDAKYVIWKNGILLVHNSGTRSIIEVTDQTTRVYLSMQCVKGFELELVKQRSKLVHLLKSLAHKVCPMVELSEVLLLPHTCYPPEKMPEMSIKEIACSFINHHPFVVVSDPSEATPTALQHVKLSDLIFFDSLHALDRTCLVEVFAKKDLNRLVSSTSLARVCESISSNGELQAKLEGMHKLSYSQLYAELRQYSLFPERNIFVSFIFSLYRGALHLDFSCV